MRLLEGQLTVEDTDSLATTLREVGQAHGCAVQAFDADLIAGRQHLERAVELANRAMARGENVARDRSVEILLYAAGRRQINEALAFGLDEGTGPAIVLADADPGIEKSAEVDAIAALEEQLAIQPTPTIEKRDTDRIRTQFEIRDPELAATTADLEALVCERVVLLDVEK